MTLPHAHSGSDLTTPGSLVSLSLVGSAVPPASSPSRPDRQASGSRGAPGRAPECKSASPWPPSVVSATSRVSELPDTAAPDPLAQARCRMVAEVVEELTMMVGDRQQLRRDRRRMMTHVRQIAMYVSHVVLQVSLTDIGVAFGRDRSTVSYSCHVVEDRRDDADFEAFVSAIERVIAAVFPKAGDAGHA